MVDQVIDIIIGLQDDAAASAAIAAAGASLGTVGLTLEGNAAFAAMAGACINFNLINKHEREMKAKKRRGKNRPRRIL